MFCHCFADILKFNTTAFSQKYWYIFCVCITILPSQFTLWGILAVPQNAKLVIILTKNNNLNRQFPCLDFLQIQFSVRNGLELFQEKTYMSVIHAEFVLNILLSLIFKP